MEKKRFFEEGFDNYLQDLIEKGFLNETECGVCRQIIEQGYSSLKGRQPNVLNQIIRKYTKEHCKECKRDILWKDMIDALENGGYCYECKDSIDNFEREIEKDK